MTTSLPLVAFNSLMIKALALNDRSIYPEELDAFSTAFRGQRFRLLITDGILVEYQTEANNPPAFLVQPVLNSLASTQRTVYLDEYSLGDVTLELSGLPSEHRAFIRDTIAANASYLITKRQRWLSLSEQTENTHGLRIVTPAQFVQFEG